MKNAIPPYQNLETRTSEEDVEYQLSACSRLNKFSLHYLSCPGWPALIESLRSESRPSRQLKVGLQQMYAMQVEGENAHLRAIWNMNAAFTAEQHVEHGNLTVPTVNQQAEPKASFVPGAGCIPCNMVITLHGRWWNSCGAARKGQWTNSWRGVKAIIKLCLVTWQKTGPEESQREGWILITVFEPGSKCSGIRCNTQASITS